MVRLVILRLLEAYFRHRWLYLLPILVMVGAAAYYLANIENKYESRSVMFVQNDSYLASLTSVRDTPYTWQTPAQQTSDEIGELLQTESFLRAIISETDLEKEMGGSRQAINEVLTEVHESVWVQPLGNNQIAIHSIHQDPSIAYQLGTAATEAYLRWKINLDKIDSETAEGFFSDIIRDYGAEVEQARATLITFLEIHPELVPNSRPETEALELQQLQTAFTQATDRYEQALAKDENARLATAQAESDIRGSYFVIDAPRIPDGATTSRRQIAKNASIFLAAGVILSVVAVSGAALLDRSLRFPIDVQHSLSLSVLASTPDVTPKRRWFWQRKKAEQAEQIEETTQDEEESAQQPEEQEESGPTTITAGSNGGSTVEKKTRKNQEDQSESSADNTQESEEKVTV